jgi:hypothetical protein
MLEGGVELMGFTFENSLYGGLGADLNRLRFDLGYDTVMGPMIGVGISF